MNTNDIQTKLIEIPEKILTIHNDLIYLNLSILDLEEDLAIIEQEEMRVIGSEMMETGKPRFPNDQMRQAELKARTGKMQRVHLLHDKLKDTKKSEMIKRAELDYLVKLHSSLKAICYLHKEL